MSESSVRFRRPFVIAVAAVLLCGGLDAALGQCPTGADFASLNCRLDELIAQTSAGVTAGALPDALLSELQRAKLRKEQAEQQCAAGHTRRAKSRLEDAIRRLIGYRHRLGSLSKRGRGGDVEPLRAKALEIMRDMQTLRGSLVCPLPSATTTTATQPPTTVTTATTSTSTTTTTGGPVCGNGTVEPPEECERPGDFSCPPSSPGGAMLECQPGCVCPGAPTTTSTTSPTTTSTTETTATTATTASTTTATNTTETTGSSTTVTTATTATTSSETATTLPETTTTATVPTTTATTESTTTATTSSTTSTTMGGCSCCADAPSLLSFTTSSSGCGTNPPGTVEPARCVQGSNNGTPCTSDATCTGGGLCRGHLDCTGLYFGGGLPSGINLPGTVPDLGLSYSKIASCDGDTVNLTATTAGDVPPTGSCPTPAGTPTFGERHCTSSGCYFGAPLALPNPGNTATGTCVHNVIGTAAGAGTGTATCSTGATNSLNLPLDSKIYLTGSLAPVAVCATCMGGTPGVCGSGTCSGGTRNSLECTPETNALNAAYPTSHDCPPPNAPATSTCGTPSQTFIGCLPIAFNLTTGTQTLTAGDPNGVGDPGNGHDRVFCGFCFDNTATFAYRNPPQPCDMDADCAAGDICRQHSDGAFRNIFATTITETGSPADACLADGNPHNSTLVSIFCIPPSYDGIVDPSGELPGPGAVSLPGVARLIP